MKEKFEPLTTLKLDEEVTMNLFGQKKSGDLKAEFVKKKTPGRTLCLVMHAYEMRELGKTLHKESEKFIKENEPED